MKTTYSVIALNINGFWDADLITQIQKQRYMNCIRDYEDYQLLKMIDFSFRNIYK